MVKVYAKGQNIEVVTVPMKDGVTDLIKLEELVDEDTAGVMVQYPNFFGQIEDLAKVEQLTHAQNALFIVSANP